MGTNSASDIFLKVSLEPVDRLLTVLLGLLSNFLKRALFFKLFYGKLGFLLVENTPRLRLATL